MPACVPMWCALLPRRRCIVTLIFVIRPGFNPDSHPTFTPDRRYFALKSDQRAPFTWCITSSFVCRVSSAPSFTMSSRR